MTITSTTTNDQTASEVPKSVPAANSVQALRGMFGPAKRTVSIEEMNSLSAELPDRDVSPLD